ncbi:MAG: hypothetical protein CALGDGBN_02903 [Pseudomonadales bacterium]|nr:hypothetical protein [Pseudomonadales bacterium]
MLSESRRRGTRVLAGIMLACAVHAQASEPAHSSINLSPGVTTVSQAIYDLHMYTLWVCVAIGVVVFGVMFWSIFAHRKSKGAVASSFHESTSLEIAWTIAPFLILLTFAAPATNTLLSIYDADEAELDVMITGYQWKWKYEYLDQGVAFFSSLSTPRESWDTIGVQQVPPRGENYLLEVDEPLVLPAGKKVRFLVTAADVIHSWWVPQLGVKKDAIPGFINETWTRVERTGTYRGQCAELCGKDHGFMPIVVEVVDEQQFASWLGERRARAEQERVLAAQTLTMDELMQRGEAVYTRSCAACHQPNGEGVPPAFPALKGSAIATGPLEQHLDIVLNGKAGTAMAAFAAQLGHADLAAVITYERNAWGNDTGDMVQPSDVARFEQSE